MAFRMSCTAVSTAEPKQRLPNEGPSAWPTPRMVEPRVLAPMGAKYHCAIVEAITNTRTWPCACTQGLVAELSTWQPGVRGSRVRAAGD